MKEHFLQRRHSDMVCDSLSSWRSQNYKTRNDVIVFRPDWGLWLRSPCWGEGGDLPSGRGGQPPLRHHGGLHCVHCPLVQGEHGPALLHVSIDKDTENGYLNCSWNWQEKELENIQKICTLLSISQYRSWLMWSWCILSYISCYFLNLSCLVFGFELLSNRSDILCKYLCIV